MILEDTRNDFMQSIYDLFSDDETNDRANQIIDIFDIATENCIELPCKVGYTVYSYSNALNTVLPYFVETIQIGYWDGKKIFMSFEANCAQKYTFIESIDFSCEDIGKTVFLTKEEAEQALRESETK